MVIVQSSELNKLSNSSFIILVLLFQIISISLHENAGFDDLDMNTFDENTYNLFLMKIHMKISISIYANKSFCFYLE